MAAAADRFAGEVLEHLSPELVLVDAALAEAARRRLDAPEDTAVCIGRLGIEPRLLVDVAAVEVVVGVDGETEIEEDAVAGERILPVPAAALEEEHCYVGIEDLIVTPEDDLQSVPPMLIVAPNDDVTQRTPEPEEIVAARDPADVIVAPSDGRAQPQSTSRSFPPLPSPLSDADEEDATDAVLRLIRDQMEHQTPSRRRRRFLSFGS